MRVTRHGTQNIRSPREQTMKKKQNKKIVHLNPTVRKELKWLLLIQEPLPDEPSKAGQRKHLLPEPGTS